MSSTAARITQPINESSLITLRGNTHPLATAKYDQGPAPVSMPANRMLLVLKRSPQQEADLKTFLSALQTPGSSSYHKFITPEQFGALYGPADADVQTVSTWLQSHGFSINKVNKAKSAIEFSGNVGQLQEAFHTSIHAYSIKGVTHYANASDPQVPAALAPAVAGLARMNNFKPKAHAVPGPRGVYDPDTNHFKPQYTTGSGNSSFLYLGPSDAATIYDSPIPGLNKNYSGTTYNGAGVNIGIVGDANIDPTAVANYRSFFGLPASAPNIIIDGDDPGIGDVYDTATGEALLDVEISGAMAPGATINLYTAADESLEYGLFLAIYRAVDDNAVSILNVSFGECEAAEGETGNEYIYAQWEEAAAQGITVTVSTGDSGSAACDDQDVESAAVYGLAVNGFASTPYDIAVGGTDFDVLKTNFSSYVNSTDGTYLNSVNGYIPENPWNNSTRPNTTIADNIAVTDSNENTNIIAAGGGQSNCVDSECEYGYAKPSWQTALTPNDGVRDLPDISLFSSNGFDQAAWAVCATGTEDGTPVNDCQPGNSPTITGFGGTSTAAPAFAGILALVSQKVGGRLGQANQVLYPLAKQVPSVFHDITVGNNSVPCEYGSNDCETSNDFLTGFQAASGYDLASGLGSVDATALVTNWNNVTFAATSTSLTLNGGTSQLSITHGTNVTVGVKVTGSGTPSGDVSINDSLSASTNPNVASVTGQLSAPITLSGGSVSATFNSLPGGTYNVSAYYGGDGTNAQSTSNLVPVVVNPENSTTAPFVASYEPYSGDAATGTSFPYGFFTAVDAQPIGVNAGSSGFDGLATGTITFGGSLKKVANLNSESFAEDSSYSFAPGSYTVTTSYSGDKSFNPSSGSVSFTITQASTSIVASSNVTTVASTANFTMSAVLGTDSLGAFPTGTVTFMANGVAVGSGTVVGVADASTGLDDATASGTIVANNLKSGSNTITAVYSGDSNYASSTSTGVIVTVTPSTGFQFVPVTPCRAVDTRNATGAFGGPSLSAGSTREFDLPNSGCGVPSTAVAYSLNVTVLPAATLQYLTLWPTGQAQPTASTLNSLDGRIKANAAITPAGTNGGVDVYVSDATNVILDVNGYFVPAATANALSFFPVTPCRVVDTRNSDGTLGGPAIAGGTSRDFPIQSGSCGLPSTAQAYSLNVTALPQTTLNYLTAWGTGSSQPNVSTLNAETGTITANAAIVPAGATGGDVSIYVSDTSNVVLDVNGYFATPASSGLSLYTVTPCRVLDTRNTSGTFSGALAVDVKTSTCAPPSTAQAYVLNATVVPPAALTYLTLWPDGATQPVVSTLNALDGAIASNMAIVPTTNGSIDAYASDPTQLILDISSYFAP